MDAVHSGLAPSENGTIYQIAISPWDSVHMFGAAYYGGVYSGGGPPRVPTLADAKGLLTDGVLFALPEKMVVSAVMPDGAAYVQKADRSHGVRVRDVAGVGPGDILSQGHHGHRERRTHNAARRLSDRQTTRQYRVPARPPHGGRSFVPISAMAATGDLQSQGYLRARLGA